VPPARRVFDLSTRMRQLRAIAMRSFRDLHASRVWWIVPFLALLFIQAAPELAEVEMGIPAPLTTARLLAFLESDISILLTLLIALSAGELVWRERGARMDALAGVTPVPDWVTVTGKFLGLTMMLVATQIIFLITGLAAQTMVGTEHYDLGLYVRILFGLQLPDYLLTAALAMVVHVLLNQKYVANVLVGLMPIARDMLRRIGVEDNLLLYGSLPRWTYSEISHFGPGMAARLWYTLYFGGWALLFALVTYLFWIRGEERGVRRKLALARQRLTGAAALFGGAALAIALGAGAFIFYNTHVLDHYRSSADMEQLRAEYEQRYGRYAALPQPSVAATKLRVDFYPQRYTATIHGSSRLENRSGAKIDDIHIATAGGVERTLVSFDRSSHATVTDDERGYRIYTLDRALAPGESLRMDFEVVIANRPFRASGIPPVSRNGSIIVHRPRNGDYWLPLVGYQWARELNDPALRKKHHLRERPAFPHLGDIPVGNEQRGYEKVELETIVGTDIDQLGVAPGEMRRSWIENGRRYVQYVTDAPISNAWMIASANYAVHRAKWNPSTRSGQPVNIEIFHDPAHTANLERMARSVQASLDYNNAQFSAYPHRQLRLVEIPGPSDMLGMTAHDGLITYLEGFALVRPEDDPRKIDFPFAVVAHEVSHQWWGHQLTPAVVEGAPFLAESLSWYSGMLIVEKTFGHEHLKRILDMMREQYLAPNRPREVPLLRAADQLDAYRTGPFAMYALREAAGAEPVNLALRRLLAKFPGGRSPYPTTLDFYRELRAATPPATHGLLKDLFEEITFWDLRAKSLDVTAAANGAHRVSFRVEAQKTKGDGTGIERPVPMNDAVAIALYDAMGKELYRGSHRLRSGVQTIELTVAGVPASAEVDPNHELLDRNIDDNAVNVNRGSGS
ncbi:MAG TPA: M1 family aminopeptidase, partial [Thermoanaerobaculia bacterium]|nr:M1 family aminopeptidase [Thermoanaerobaculia bacterium]